MPVIKFSGLQSESSVVSTLFRSEVSKIFKSVLGKPEEFLMITYSKNPIFFRGSPFGMLIEVTMTDLDSNFDYDSTIKNIIEQIFAVLPDDVAKDYTYVIIYQGISEK